MTMYEQFRESALRNSDKVAVLFYGGKIKYGTFLGYVDRVAYGLSKYIKKGDVVTICMPNSPSASIALYAVNKLGAIANLTHPLIKKEGLLRCMEKAGSNFLITYDQAEFKNDMNCTTFISDSGFFMSKIAAAYYRFSFRKKIGKYDKSKRFENLIKNPPLKETEACESASVYLPSGGTTGEPKIVMHSDDAFNNLALQAQCFLSDKIPAYNSMYSVLPIFHGFGLCMNLHISTLHGITNVMTLKFNAKSMAKAIEKERINIITGVPAMFNKLLGCKEFMSADLSSVKDCFVGGDAVSDELVDKFDAALKRGGSKAKLHAGYGLTETVTVCAVITDEHYKKGSVGYPLPGCEMCITDGTNKLPAGEVGELCIRTPIMMLGYYGTDEKPIRKLCGEDWLFTGDICYIDEDGFLFFKQRAKNMIKVSGVPVFPSEIENIVTKIEGVRNAAAMGVPDPVKGEVVKLFVEKADGADENALSEQITAEIKRNLMVYALPKFIEYRTLPLNAIGKVDRKQLS